jgi:hypothetical protein
MNSAWIGWAAVAIGVPLTFAVLRRIYPAQPALSSSRTLEDLRGEYARWELLGLPLYLLFAPIGTYLCWQLFLGVSDGVGFIETNEGLFLWPAPIAWLLPAMFFGLILSWPPIDFIYRRMLRERYPEYVAYQSRRFGINFQKLLFPFYAFLAGLSALFVLLLANCYVHITPEHIRINPFFGVSERVYPYAEVSNIRTAPAFIAPNGNRVDRRLFIVTFSDSRTWNTNDNPSDASESEVVAVIRAISERSGKPISEVSLLMREDL